MQTNDFQKWLESIGLTRHAQALLDNEIDFDVLSDVTDEELAQLGLPLGARKRLLKAIADGDKPTGASGAVNLPASKSQAERRQVTVLFFDLAGSTALSTRLDPEDLREVIGSFQSAIAKVVTANDGFVARYMGDALLCYFGWPSAHEDAASRAVRAALQAQREVGEMPLVLSEPLKARAGIATGQVVVGDLIGEGASEEEAIIGQTPNLAARLQGAADPGQVVISATTHSLVGENFETIDLASLSLKGFEGTQRAHIVIRERVGGTRFALKEDRQLPILGREHELGLLRDRWRLASAGEGQCVVLSGEAGIGKSRLVSSLLEIEDLQQKAIVLQCSSNHMDTMLWPVVDYLTDYCRIGESATAEHRIEQLHQLIGNTPPLPVEQAVAALADLLGMQLPSQYQEELAPEERRQRILASLVHWMSEATARLIVVEDVHWIDPTTLNLLHLLLDRVDKGALMLLITSRPENCPPFPDSSLLTQLSLNRLGRQVVKQMISEIFTREVPDDYLQLMIERSDGVPLYVEELTRASITGIMQDIPPTLQDGLMARLDAQPQVRRIAQRAACIGRDFGLELLEAISEETSAQLQIALQRLVETGLLLRTKVATGSQYRFKHALLRDAAYQSLLKREQSQVHAEIASSMAMQNDCTQSIAPEQIAAHYQLADQNEKAFGYWVEACKRAVKSSAITEALAHGARGLDALDKVPENKDRDELEYELLMVYGHALQLGRGAAVEATVAVFDRAVELAEKLGSARLQLMAQLNVWSYKHHSGDLQGAIAQVEKNISMSARLEDPELSMQVNHAAWTTGFHSMPLDVMEHHVCTGLDLYDVDSHKLCWSRFGGHDPAVCGNAHHAWIEWFRGYPENAQKKAEACMLASSRVDHPNSELVALFLTSFLFFYALDPASLLKNTDAIAKMARRIKVGDQQAAAAKLLSGWAHVRSGYFNEGMKQIDSGLSSLQSINSNHRQSFNALLYADALAYAGQTTEAITAAKIGIEKAEKTGETRWKGELIRLSARLSWNNNELTDTETEKLYLQAMAHADIFGGRIYRLRAIRDLADLFAQRNSKEQAYKLLHGEYQWFTQGLGEVDLLEAADQLKKLR